MKKILSLLAVSAISLSACDTEEEPTEEETTTEEPTDPEENGTDNGDAEGDNDLDSLAEEARSGSEGSMADVSLEVSGTWTPDGYENATGVISGQAQSNFGRAEDVYVYIGDGETIIAKFPFDAEAAAEAQGLEEGEDPEVSIAFEYPEQPAADPDSDEEPEAVTTDPGTYHVLAHTEDLYEEGDAYDTEDVQRYETVIIDEASDNDGE